MWICTGIDVCLRYHHIAIPIHHFVKEKLVRLTTFIPFIGIRSPDDVGISGSIEDNGGRSLLMTRGYGRRTIHSRHLAVCIRDKQNHAKDTCHNKQNGRFHLSHACPLLLSIPLDTKLLVTAIMHSKNSFNIYWLVSFNLELSWAFCYKITHMSTFNHPTFRYCSETIGVLQLAKSLAALIPGFLHVYSGNLKDFNRVDRSEAIAVICRRPRRKRRRLF